MNIEVAAREIVVHCEPRLRAEWPNPLAVLWHAEYPGVFDDDDLRLTSTQPDRHFGEWFIAVHVFRTLGAVSLIEKYLFANHHRKEERLRKIMSPSQVETLRSICVKVQPPDLLIHLPTENRFWFAEVKRPGEKVLPNQRESHKLITSQLGAHVEIYRVKVGHAG
jgi:hypothetical protein